MDDLEYRPLIHDNETDKSRGMDELRSPARALSGGDTADRVLNAKMVINRQGQIQAKERKVAREKVPAGSCL